MTKSSLDELKKRLEDLKAKDEDKKPLGQVTSQSQNITQDPTNAPLDLDKKEDTPTDLEESLSDLPVVEDYKDSLGRVHSGNLGGVMTYDTLVFEGPILTDTVLASNEESQLDEDMTLVSEKPRGFLIKNQTVSSEGQPLSFLHESQYLSSKSPKTFKYSLYGFTGLFLVGLGLFTYSKYQPKNTSKEQTSQVVKPVTSTSEEKKEIPKSHEDKIRDLLNQKAKKSGVSDHVINLEPLVGGYLLGSTVYYPDDEVKKYTDFSLHAPENKEGVLTDERATKQEELLRANGDVINDTIQVKDMSKVSMETYQKSEEELVTILNYQEKDKVTPFAYVTGDKDFNLINHVTTYYVASVAK